MLKIPSFNIKKVKQIKFLIKSTVNHYCQHFSYYINKPFCLPTEIHFVPTKRCNLRCKYCRIWEEGNIKDELDAETWKKFLNDLHDWVGDAHIGITGGEPFMRKDIFDILEHMKKLGFKISLTTNGLLLSQEVIEKLIQIEPFNVNISLDSINPGSHDFFRGDGNFEKTYQNILKFKKELNRCNSPILLIIETTLNQENIENIKDLVEFCIKNNLKIHLGNITENLSIDYKGDYKGESEYRPKSPKKIIESFNYLTNVRKNTNVILSSSSALNMIRDYYLGKKIKFTCAANIKNLFIDADGSIKLCFNTPPVGNIKNLNVKNVWYSKEANEMRKFMKKCKKICQFYCHKKRSLYEHYEMYKSIFN